MEQEIKKYYNLETDLKNAFKKNHPPFVKSMIIYGSMARDELLPPLSDLDVMIFYDKKILSIKELQKISKINEQLAKKHRIHMTFRIHDIKELENTRSDDLLYPYLFDTLLNSYCIYGENMESKMVAALKKIGPKTAKDEYWTAINSPIQKFYTGYFNNNSYQMADGIYDVYHLINLFQPLKYKIHFSIKKQKKTRKYWLAIFKKLESNLRRTKFRNIYLKNKSLELLFGDAAGGIVYNPELKKILILEHSYGGGGWWAFPKGHIEHAKKENYSGAIKREIFEETGIKKITIGEHLFTGHHWFKRNGWSFRKTKTDFYLIRTNEQDVRVSEEHLNYKWVSFGEIDKFIKSSGLKFVAEQARKKLRL